MTLLITLTILFMIVIFALEFFAGLSTESTERKWLDNGFVAVSVLGIITLYVIEHEPDFAFRLAVMCVISFGMVLPRLFANIITQSHLESPVIFIERKQKPLHWILAFVIWPFLTFMVLQPNRGSDSAAITIYDNDFVGLSVSR